MDGPDLSSVGSELTRRELLAAAVAGGGAGTAGFAVGRGLDGTSDRDGDLSETAGKSTSNFWMAQHRNFVTDKPDDALRRRFACPINTTIQLIDISYTETADPAPDSEGGSQPGSFRYTFYVNSSAPALAPAELASPEAVPRNTEFDDWPAQSAGVDYVPVTDELLQNYRETLPTGITPPPEGLDTEIGGSLSVTTAFDFCASDGVSSYDATETTAVAVRRDADLYGFDDPARATELYRENQALANGYRGYNSSMVPNVNLNEARARFEERQEDLEASLNIFFTLLSLALGAKSSLASPALDLLLLGDDVLELIDSADLGQPAAYQGFQQRRPPNARGPVGGFHAVIDAYVSANDKGHFAVEYEHPIANLLTRPPTGDRDIYIDETSYDLNCLSGDAFSAGGRFGIFIDAPGVSTDGSTEGVDYEITYENLPRFGAARDPGSGRENRAYPLETTDLNPVPQISVPEGGYEYTGDDTTPFTAHRSINTIGGRISAVRWSLEELSTSESPDRPYVADTVRRKEVTPSGGEAISRTRLGDALEWAPDVTEGGHYRLRLVLEEVHRFEYLGGTAAGLEQGQGEGVATEMVHVTDDDRPIPQVDADPSLATPGEPVTLTASNLTDTAVERWTWNLPEDALQNPDEQEQRRSGDRLTVTFPYTSDRVHEIKLVAVGANDMKGTTLFELPMEPGPDFEVYYQPADSDERKQRVTVDPGTTITPEWEIPRQFEVTNHDWRTDGTIVEGLEGRQPNTVDPVSVRFDEARDEPYTVQLWIGDETGASAVEMLEVEVGDTATAGWNQVHADTRNTAVGSNAALGEADTVSGTSLFEPGSRLATPLMAAGGTVYLGAGQTLYGVSADGDVEWEIDLGTGLASTLALADGVAYCGLGRGQPSLSAVSVGSTEKRWESDVTLPYQPQPTVVGDRIYVGRESRLSAVSTEDGALQWEANLGSDIEGVITAPAVAGDTVYATSDDGNLYAVSRAEGTRGEVRWSYETGDRYFDPDTSAPTVVDGTVYFGTQDTALHAVSTDGEREWTFETPRPVLSSPAVGDGVVTFVSDDTLYCFSLDGERQWETETTVQSAIAFRSLAVVDGAVIAADPPGGSVTAFSTTDGEQLWTFDGGGRSPAVGEDALYVFGDEGLLSVSPD